MDMQEIISGYLFLSFCGWFALPFIDTGDTLVTWICLGMGVFGLYVFIKDNDKYKQSDQ